MDSSHLPASWSKRLSWLLLLLVVVLGVGAIILFVLNRHTSVPPSWGALGGPRDNLADLINIVLQGFVMTVSSALLGVLVLGRHPHQPIGWLLCAVGVLGSLSAFFVEWTVYGYFTSPVPLPGVGVVAWVTNWIWIFLYATLLWVLAIFPDGASLNRRWRLITATPILLFASLSFTASAIETPMSSAFLAPNPFVARDPEWIYNILFPIGAGIIMPLAILVTLVQVLVRFRQSRGRERQQMKWLLSGVALMAVIAIAGLILGQGLGIRFGDFLVNSAFLAALAGIGVAMLRHRLYDIDLIIRRTLIYSVLTALLALVYFGSVVVLQGLVTAVQGEPSSLTIVLSTLAIAVLFSPLRRRVQQVIDRRFFRRKYDAAQMLNQFAQTARAEAELDKLGQELLAVVGKTMQPETAWLWLRGESGSKNNERS